MTATKKQVTLDDVKELLPKHVSLVYVDYLDNLDDHPDTIEKIVSDNSLDHLFEQIDEWFEESEHNSIEEYLKQLKEDLIDKFNFEEVDAEEYIENNRDDIIDVLIDRCNDDTVRDLMRNTGDEIFFFDTGLEIPSESWSWSKKDMRHWLYEVKKTLQIKKNKSYDGHIEMMLSQATYGGSLVIYFTASPTDLINDKGEEEDWRSVQFTNPNIAVIDTGGGSGDDTFLNGHQVTLPFLRDRLTLDRSIKYNYSFAVCGMVNDWCKDTKYKFGEIGEPVTSSSTNKIKAEIKRDLKYAEIYKQGKCSFGDMDIKRHRAVSYLNNFPCGNKCAHCGTFWID